MSKYLYIIIPVLLLGAFIGYFIVEKNAIEQENARKAAIALAEKKKKEAQDAEMREKSRLQAAADAAERKRKEEEKVAAEKAAFEASIQRLRDDTAGYINDQNKSKAEIAELEAQIAAVRAEKEKLARQSVEMNQTIVEALVARQNAEVEVQLFAAKVARRALDSPMVKIPETPASAAGATQSGGAGVGR